MKSNFNSITLISRRIATAQLFKSIAIFLTKIVQIGFLKKKRKKFEGLNALDLLLLDFNLAFKYPLIDTSGLVFNSHKLN